VEVRVSELTEAGYLPRHVAIPVDVPELPSAFPLRTMDEAAALLVLAAQRVGASDWRPQGAVGIYVVFRELRGRVSSGAWPASARPDFAGLLAAGYCEVRVGDGFPTFGFTPAAFPRMAPWVRVG
jgi:hypothetical protein